jgi:uncharacterized cupredoxin-like copper-binding protein
MSIDRAVAALGLGLAAALGGVVVAGAMARGHEPLVVEVRIHYSHFEPSSVTVPADRPVTFVLVNSDPIDHEWIVGDAATHLRHRTGTEPYHAARPTEITIPAGTERRTTLTFEAPATLQYICHLPGHEAYGMVGTVTITPTG